MEKLIDGRESRDATGIHSVSENRTLRKQKRYCRKNSPFYRSINEKPLGGMIDQNLKVGIGQE